MEDFIKNLHEKIKDGELIQCQRCWIHCLGRKEELEKCEEEEDDEQL